MDWAEEKYDVSAVCTRKYTQIQTLQSVKILILFCVWPQKLLIAQVKMVLKVLFLYIPLPMFWALFDQQVATSFLLHTYCMKKRNR